MLQGLKDGERKLFVRSTFCLQTHDEAKGGERGVNIVTVTRNTRQYYAPPFWLIIHYTCSPEQSGGREVHREGKMREGGVLEASGEHILI